MRKVTKSLVTLGLCTTMLAGAFIRCSFPWCTHVFQILVFKFEVERGKGGWVRLVLVFFPLVLDQTEKQNVKKKNKKNKE